MRREKVLHMHERIALDKPLLPRLCKMMPLGGQLFSALLKPVEIGGRKIVFAFERDAPRGLPFVWPSWVCNFRSNFDRHRCQFCSSRQARRDHLIAAVARKIQVSPSDGASMRGSAISALGRR